MEADELKRAEALVRNLAAEVLGKLDRGKRVDRDETVALAVYLALTRLEELRGQVENVLRAFKRLDELVEVVRELRAALQASGGEEVARRLRAVEEGIGQILNRLEAYTVEES